MCLLVLAWRVDPRYPLIVAANRDEFHERPAAPLARWEGAEGIVAGRDLRAGGTWLGIDAKHRFGVVTNFRDMQPAKPGAPSRGELITGYLRQSGTPGAFFGQLESAAARYAGFNLLLADGESLWYGSNRNEPFAYELKPGIHGLSNQLLDTPWPKLVRVRRKFTECVTAGVSVEGLFAILNDRERSADDGELPQTGLSLEMERVVSSPFVLDARYGTRCSTVVLMGADGAVEMVERRFDARGEAVGETRHASAAR